MLAFDVQPEERPVPQTVIPAEDARIAFGKFVNLMRRRRGYTLKWLAEVAELEASELLIIEDDIRYVPEPRTVYKLAQTFEVSHQRLLQLACKSARSGNPARHLNFRGLPCVSAPGPNAYLHLDRILVAPSRAMRSDQVG